MRRLCLLVSSALVACLALPALAQADEITLSNADGISFTGAGAGDVYPSVITSAPTGTINDVNASVQESHANPDDLDVTLVSPNGTGVTLMSDACGADAEFQTLRFDDSAGLALSNGGPCDQSFIYIPSQYPDVPDAYPAPAPATQLTSLGAFNGGPSGGTWSLHAVDDTAANNGSITSWSVTINYTPDAGSTAPNPEQVICAGRPSTQLGTEGDNTMIGTPGPDVISGAGGNDTISGVNGKDVICGGAGKDTLRGGKGKDRLLGQAGKDKLRGGKGKDVLKGGGGKDNERQ